MIFFKNLGQTCGGFIFLAFLPSRALLATMARRGTTPRPKATARHQKLFIKSHAVWQIAVTQLCQDTSPFRRVLMLSYQPCLRLGA